MPIPTLTDQPPAPRRLLRDVVYDKMFDAIIDGTLEFGERLNDDQLVAWLGVSRTPVREAIAKLADQALVDIEANRYTRIVAPTFAEFTDTVETGYQVWALVAERGVPALTKEQRKEVTAILDRRLTAFSKRKPEDVADLVRMNELLLDASGSSSLRRLWAATGPRLLLVLRRPATDGMYPWEQAVELTRGLRDAVAAGDGEAAARLVREQPASFGAYFDEVSGSGIYAA